MKPLAPHPVLGACLSIVRYLLSVTFLFSGVSKLFYLPAFSTEVAQYTELYISDVFVSWSEIVAVSLCMVEIFLGVALCLKRLSVSAGCVAVALLSFFLYLTAVNYLFPTALGSLQSCGCFGEWLRLSPKASFVKSLVLWGISIFWLVLSLRTQHRPHCTKGENPENL